MTHATAVAMRPPFPAERGVNVYNHKLAMYAFLASEVMFFGALIGAYIILRLGAPGEWVKRGAVLNVSVTAFNTFLLVTSSLWMAMAHRAIARGNQKMLRTWLGLTIVFGAAFVTIQALEYVHLMERGLLASGVRDGSELAGLVANGTLPATVTLYGACFYTLTGFHGFHVTCGVLSMTYLFFTKALRGKYSQQDYRGIEVVGLYWHFVDVVWIILFTIIYLI
jgi:cytochrome c oxidase subunit III